MSEPRTFEAVRIWREGDDLFFVEADGSVWRIKDAEEMATVSEEKSGEGWRVVPLNHVRDNEPGASAAIFGAFVKVD